ncbi:M48 family metalloprotease [Rhodobacteraceae bacterium Araon29]
MSDTVKGRFHDGISAKSHQVSVTHKSNGQELKITGPTLQAAIYWPLADIRAAQKQGREKTTILFLDATADAAAQNDSGRLIIEGTEAQNLLSEMPNLYLKKTKRSDLRKALVRSVIALGSLAAILLLILPSLALILAEALPIKREAALGQTVMKQIELLFSIESDDPFICETDKGRRALDKMTAKILSGEKLDYDLRVLVTRHDMLNAFALPGGIILLTNELIQSADTPEELAGVLAHELGHVVARDPLRALIYSASTAGILSLVVGDFSGGTLVYILADQALNGSYSRRAERHADAFSIEKLQHGEIDLKGFERFFERVEELAPDFLENFSYISTHPPTAERRVAIATAARHQSTVKPVLSAAEWQLIKAMCKKKDG